MFYQIKRHPFPVTAYFSHSLVLTYALPEGVLRPLLPPGLDLDCFEQWGFVAIALVQTHGLKPAFLPGALGQNFFLSGYRIFSKFPTTAGVNNKPATLRGLRILRSDTDKPFMALAGNLLTHYNYHLAKVEVSQQQSALSIKITTPNAEADLEVSAELSSAPASLPEGSPFSDMETAKHFAGPLPFTFDYEKQTNSIIVIKGVRKQWNPQPVRVDVSRLTFFDREEFRGCEPILANAFHVQNIPYSWKRGRRVQLGGFPT
jgi:hypothetical protein